MWWEVIFLMGVLKLPIVYLCVVVYWAIRAEPRPFEPVLLAVAPLEPCPWTSGRRGRRGPSRPAPRPRRAVARR